MRVEADRKVPFDHVYPLRRAILRALPALESSLAWTYAPFTADRAQKYNPVEPRKLRLRVPRVLGTKRSEVDMGIACEALEGDV
ncbi:MAG: hypothetical protein AAFU79_36000, partial [Myxococcota bacterium]